MAKRDSRTNVDSSMNQDGVIKVNDPNAPIPKKSDALTKYDPGIPVEAIDTGESKLISDDAGQITTVGTQLSNQLSKEARTPQEAVNAFNAGVVLDDAVEQEQIAAGSTVSNMLYPEASNAAPIDMGIGGSGQALSNFIQSQPMSTTPSVYTEGLGMNQFDITPDKRALYESYARSVPRQKPVQAAIEQLGAQDYFPSLKDNIAVGSYSRKTLGSGNIYVAGGGLLPFGIMDARKRAIEAEAKRKQELADKLRNLDVHTSPQFDVEFGDTISDKALEFYELSGGDYSRLTNPNDPLGKDYLKFIDYAPRIAKEIATTDAQVRKIIDDFNGVKRDSQGNPSSSGTRKYVPEFILNKALEWQQGKSSYLQEALTGEVAPSHYMDFFRSYDNAYAMADEKLKEIAKNPDIMPLDPRKDFNIKDPAQAENARQALLMAKKNGYDQYLSVVHKYFDADRLEGIVNGMFSQDNLYKGYNQKEQNELKKELTDYMINNLFNQVEVKTDNQANDDMERAELALRKRQFEYQQQQDLTKYSYEALQGNAVKETILSNPYLSPKQKEEAMKAVYVKDNNYSKSASQRWGTATRSITMSQSEIEQQQSGSLSTTQAKVMGANGKYTNASLQDVKNDAYWAKTRKGYKPKYDHSDVSTQNANEDAVAISKSNPDGAYYYTTAERTTNVMSKDPNTNKVVPASWNAQGYVPFNAVHDQVNKTLKNPVIDPETGKQKLDKEGMPVYTTYMIKSELVVSRNLDDISTQVSYDVPSETSQINKNINIGF